MRNTLDRIEGWWGTAGKMSELEGTAIGTIPNTTCTIKRIQTKENNLSELWDYFKQHNKYKIGIPQK